MMSKHIFQKEPVLSIATCLAIISAFFVPPDGKTKSCTANTTDNVHKVSYIILYKEDTVYLLA